MKLTWLGHACFLLEQDGYRLILDPYAGVAGYPDLRAEAHEVLCSHGHFDHHAVEAVTLLPARESPFTVRTVETFHDPEGGALRGSNTVHVLSAGGVTLAHLGDLGHQLTARQLAELGRLDGVLVPVGGTYTVDAAGAKQVCEAIAPRWIVPMHYHHPPYGLPNVSGVEDFLALWPRVRRLSGPSLELTADLEGVLVPSWEDR